LQKEGSKNWNRIKTKIINKKAVNFHAAKKGKNPERPPTEKQEVRKSKSLIKGKTEGEMIIKNVKPKVIKGEHIVEEAEIKDDIKYKETNEGEIRE